MNVCNHTQCHASNLRQVQIGVSSTSDIPAASVLAEKRCSHLPERKHAITCKPDQSSHVGVTHTHMQLQHQVRKLNLCAPAQRPASAFV